jgi:hypothetical protein
MEFYWNLGITINNKAEVYSPFLGIQLENQRQIFGLNILGDSKNIIHYFFTASSSKDIGLKILVDRIRISLCNYKAQFFHIYRHHNEVVDSMENKVIGLAHGLMGVEGEEHTVNPS